MSMAVTTAPKVFCTASPIFLAIKVPLSSSAKAASNSSERENASTQPHSTIIQNTMKRRRGASSIVSLNVAQSIYVIAVELTFRNAPVLKAGITDPHRCEAPSPLRHRPGLGGAAVAETLSTGSTVVLCIIILEGFTTFVAVLFWHKTNAL